MRLAARSSLRRLRRARQPRSRSWKQMQGPARARRPAVTKLLKRMRPTLVRLLRKQVRVGVGVQRPRKGGKRSFGNFGWTSRAWVFLGDGKTLAS